MEPISLLTFLDDLRKIKFSNISKLKLNALLNPISALRTIYGNEEINKLDADKLRQNLEEYRHYIGLQPNGIFNDKATAAFEDLVTKNPQGTAIFEKTKGADGKEIYAKLKASNGQAPAIDIAINTALEKSKAFNDAKNRYTASVSRFEAICKKIPQQCSAHGLMNNIATLIQDSKEAIKNQHESELNNLNKLFQHNSTTLKDVLGIDTNDTTTLDQVKKNMIADLTTLQTKQLTDFEKETQEATKKLCKAIEKQALLVTMLENDKTGKLREEINKVAEKKAADERKKNPHSPIPLAALSLAGHGNNDRLIDIKGVNIDELEFTVACHGAIINKVAANTVDKDGQPEYTYTVDLPRIIFSPLRYGSPVDKTTAILETLALQIKANGYEGIELNVDFSNDDLQKTRNQQAYRACILAGFPPDKIVIKNHGHEVKADAIFDPNALNNLHQESSKIQQNRSQPLIKEPLTKQALQSTKEKEEYKRAEKVIDDELAKPLQKQSIP